MTNAELLLALFEEDELEALQGPIPKKPETAFCCGKLIERYIVPCPHCGGDPYPF